MDIFLDNLFPHVFENRDISSGVWGSTLAFSQGMKVHIRAPSAKGKTTLVSMLYGIRRDFDGEIRFDKRNTGSFSPNDWALLRQQKISIVFQDLRLFPHFTAHENILIKARLTKTTGDDAIVHFAEKLGIQDTLDKNVTALSRGEKQRVAILRALVQPFTWLLLDEPFSHLDKENRTRAIELITSGCEERKAGLIITSLEKDTFFQYKMKVSM